MRKKTSVFTQTLRYGTKVLVIRCILWTNLVPKVFSSLLHLRWVRGAKKRPWVRGCLGTWTVGIMISTFVLLCSNPAYWTVKVCMRLNAEDRTGNMNNLNFFSCLCSWNWKLCETIVTSEQRPKIRQSVINRLGARMKLVNLRERP